MKANLFLYLLLSVPLLRRYRRRNWPRRAICSGCAIHGLSRLRTGTNEPFATKATLTGDGNPGCRAARSAGRLRIYRRRSRSTRVRSRAGQAGETAGPVANLETPRPGHAGSANSAYTLPEGTVMSSTRRASTSTPTDTTHPRTRRRFFLRYRLTDDVGFRGLQTGHVIIAGRNRGPGSRPGIQAESAPLGWPERMADSCGFAGGLRQIGLGKRDSIGAGRAFHRPQF